MRDGRIWYVLLSTFAASGLLLAMAQSAFAKEQNAWGAVQGGLALFTAFYGVNAAGWLTMQSARGLDDAAARGGPVFVFGITPAQATAAILEGLMWLGLDWDGEPISQAGRADRHAEVAREMLAAGQVEDAARAIHSAFGLDGDTEAVVHAGTGR